MFSFLRPGLLVARSWHSNANCNLEIGGKAILPVESKIISENGVFIGNVPGVGMYLSCVFFQTWQMIHFGSQFLSCTRACKIYILQLINLSVLSKPKSIGFETDFKYFVGECLWNP